MYRIMCINCFIINIILITRVCGGVVWFEEAYELNDRNVHKD